MQLTGCLESKKVKMSYFYNTTCFNYQLLHCCLLVRSFRRETKKISAKIMDADCGQLFFTPGYGFLNPHMLRLLATGGCLVTRCQ